MSQSLEYVRGCGKKSLLKIRLLRNTEQGSSNTRKKKKRLMNEPVQKNLSANSPVLSHEIQHHTPGCILGG